MHLLMTPDIFQYAILICSRTICWIPCDLKRNLVVNQATLLIIFFFKLKISILMSIMTIKTLILSLNEVLSSTFFSYLHYDHVLLVKKKCVLLTPNIKFNTNW